MNDPQRIATDQLRPLSLASPPDGLSDILYEEPGQISNFAESRCAIRAPLFVELGEWQLSALLLR